MIRACVFVTDVFVARDDDGCFSSAFVVTKTSLARDSSSSFNVVVVIVVVVAVVFFFIVVVATAAVVVLFMGSSFIKLSIPRCSADSRWFDSDFVF